MLTRLGQTFLSNPENIRQPELSWNFQRGGRGEREYWPKMGYYWDTKIIKSYTEVYYFVL